MLGFRNRCLLLFALTIIFSSSVQAITATPVCIGDGLPEECVCDETGCTLPDGDPFCPQYPNRVVCAVVDEDIKCVCPENPPVGSTPVEFGMLTCEEYKTIKAAGYYPNFQIYGRQVINSTDQHHIAHANKAGIFSIVQPDSTHSFITDDNGRVLALDYISGTPLKAEQTASMATRSLLLMNKNSSFDIMVAASQLAEGMSSTIVIPNLPENTYIRGWIVSAAVVTTDEGPPFHALVPNIGFLPNCITAPTPSPSASSTPTVQPSAPAYSCIDFLNDNSFDLRKCACAIPLSSNLPILITCRGTYTDTSYQDYSWQVGYNSQEHLLCCEGSNTEPSSSPSIAPSVTPTASSTPAVSSTPTATQPPKASPSATPTSVPVIPSPSQTPQATPSTTPTVKPSVSQVPSATASSVPPKASPSDFPQVTPSTAPTVKPSVSQVPSATASSVPPKASPSDIPQVTPSKMPSASPSTTPSTVPVKPSPSQTPQVTPSTTPSAAPSVNPSSQPSTEPTAEPSVEACKKNTSNFTFAQKLDNDIKLLGDNVEKLHERLAKLYVKAGQRSQATESRKLASYAHNQGVLGWETIWSKVATTVYECEGRTSFCTRIDSTVGFIKLSEIHQELQQMGKKALRKLEQMRGSKTIAVKRLAKRFKNRDLTTQESLKRLSTAVGALPSC